MSRFSHSDSAHGKSGTSTHNGNNHSKSNISKLKDTHKPALVYNIAEEHISGVVGGVKIDAHAGSGGRAGTKTAGAENWYLKNNALATHVHSGSHTFGPLPMGRYRMVKHPDHATWVRLIPLQSNIMHGRAGFAIHPRGPTGSHGCIVPDDVKVVKSILAGIAHEKKAGRSDPVIEVVAVGVDLDRKFNTA